MKGASKATQPVLVKIGGSTLGSLDTTLEDLVTLQRRGEGVVVVHGGGQVISRWMERSGTLPQFVRGLRVTDAATLEVVVAVLTGLVNKQLVVALQALGARAIGISGADGGLLQARVMDRELGFVGQVVGVNPEPVQILLERGYIPVVAPVGTACQEKVSESGALLNINGDTAAGELAYALEARLLLFLTDVEGVLDSSRRLVSRLLPEHARTLIASGAVAGGMIPKVEACLRALERVPAARIVDGRRPHALLECLEGMPLGTQVG